MPKVLVVEDDITFSKILSNYLTRHGYQVHEAHNLVQSFQLLQSVNPEIVLLDYHLPDGSGFDFLQYRIEHAHKVPVIMMTSFHDVRTAVRSIKKGATDYITKPINQEELLMLMKEAITGKGEVRVDRQIQDEPGEYVKGKSEASKQLYNHIELVAGTDMSVLINGESGTGKEHVARTLHLLSKRAAKPFVAIDCGALSPELAASELFGHLKGSFTGALQDKKGQFELADGGTVFLDEVGNLSYEVQLKLLRAIEEREIIPVGGNKPVKINVRIITATNESFQSAIRQGKFREDLYHRLNEFKLKTPSLTERREDMDDFISFFIRQANKDLDKQVKNIDEEVRQLFLEYSWPGNIRELKNIIKRAVLLAPGDMITLTELPEEMELTLTEEEDEKEQSSDLKRVQEQIEKEMILKTLKETNYNKSKAAKLLNIDRTTLYNKLARYGIDS